MNSRNNSPDSIIEAGLAAPPAVMATTPHPEANAGQNKSMGGFSVERLIQSKLAVLAVLFGVTGFLGLPLLWMNKRFSDFERWLWALLNIVYTSTLIYGAFRICLWSYRQIFP
jgi:hypothetical protein